MRAALGIAVLVPLLLGLPQPACALSGRFESTDGLNLRGDPFAGLCVKKAAECDVICSGVVKDQSCSAKTGAWSCDCGVAPPKLGTGAGSEQPFKEACAKKTLDCSAMCKGATKENTCSPTTGAWSCQCGVVPTIGTSIGGGGRRRAGSSKPYAAKCETKKKECDALCKGSVKDQSCSATTGSYSCQCGKAPTIGTGTGSVAGHWSKFTVKITTKAILAEANALITLVDALAWKVTKTTSVGHVVVSKGDILMKMGAMKGKLIVESSSLKVGSTLWFKHWSKTSTPSVEDLDWSEKKGEDKKDTSTETKKTSTETKGAWWRKTGSWQKVTISVESSVLMRKLASKLDTGGALTEDLFIGGIKLLKGDHVLKEGSTEKASGSTISERVASLTKGSLVVDVQGLKAASNRRRYGGASSQCDEKRTTCGTRCGGAIAAWSCTWSSTVGTKYSCQCSGSSSGGAKLTSGSTVIETSVTSRALLQRLLRSIDTKTWTFTKDIKIGKQVVGKGDKLLQEADLSGKTSLSVSSLLKLKTAHLRILHVQESTETRTDTKTETITGKTDTTSRETETTTGKTGKTETATGTKITLGSGTLSARLKILEGLIIKQQEQINSLRACAGTCCKGQCVEPGPAPVIQLRPSPTPTPIRRRRAPAPTPRRRAPSSARRRRFSIPSTTPTAAGRRRRRLDFTA